MYAAQADLLTRLTEKTLTELSDFDGVGQMNADVIAAALADASSKIDAYARGRYRVPLAASDQLKSLCLDLTIWRLYTNRMRPLPEALKNASDRAIAFLKDVAAGRASLDGQTAETQQSSEMGVVSRNHDADPEVFDENKLTGF